MRCNYLLAGLGLLISTGVVSGAVVSVPYTNDFSTSVSDFATVGSWTHASGVYTNSITTDQTGASIAVQATDLGGPAASAADFQMSMDFRLTTTNTATNTVGFGVLGPDSNFTDGTGAFYLADVQRTGNLRLFAINPNTSLKEQLRGAQLVVDRDYRLVLAGDYDSAGDLMLTLTLVDNASEFSISLPERIPAANVLTGNHFGIRNRTANGDQVVRIDNFSLIPEPAALSLLAPALLLGRRARRAAAE